MLYHKELIKQHANPDENGQNKLLRRSNLLYFSKTYNKIKEKIADVILITKQLQPPGALWHNGRDIILMIAVSARSVVVLEIKVFYLLIAFGVSILVSATVLTFKDVSLCMRDEDDSSAISFVFIVNLILYLLEDLYIVLLTILFPNSSTCLPGRACDISGVP